MLTGNFDCNNVCARFVFCVLMCVCENTNTSDWLACASGHFKSKIQ